MARPRDTVLRVAVFLVGYFAILLAASVPKGMVPPRAADVAWGALSSLGILALTALMLRREGRHAAELGIIPDGRSVIRLHIGLGLGLGVYAVTVLAISRLLGLLTFTRMPTPSVSDLAFVVSGFLALSCMEELGFRAYPLRTLTPVIGLWPAQGLTALLFGLGHLAFGWSWASVLLGVIPSALLFGVVAVRSGGLAMPIGLHAALNLASWATGAKAAPGLWMPSVAAPNEARVASLGPIVGLAVTLLAAGAVHTAGRRRQRAA
jgi:membrane protease YdiL (CAAX protease family)